METVCFSKTLASTYESTRRQDPEEQQHRNKHSVQPYEAEARLSNS
jgi:hypothetical protein